MRFGVRHDLGRLDLGPSSADLGLDRLDLGVIDREEGFLVRGGAVMTGMRLGKENFGLGLRDWRKRE